MEKISTSKLASKLNCNSKELFQLMSDQKLIYRKNDQWNLTKKGQDFGGETVFHKEYGEYIVWPEDFNPRNMENNERQELINATKIGEEYNLTSQRVNLILTEIGWIEKSIKGWSITPFGQKNGGVQFTHITGTTYVKWPIEILKNRILKNSININYEKEDKNEPIHTTLVNDDFRNKFPANLRTKDGHQVRSRAEVIIDNALYDYGLVHAYERKLPVEEDVYSDFYIPAKNGGKAVYIEFWGLENDAKYLERKKIKKELYRKYDFNLVELEDKHLENLDDYLPRLLLNFEIKVE